MDRARKTTNQIAIALQYYITDFLHKKFIFNLIKEKANHKHKEERASEASERNFEF